MLHPIVYSQVSNYEFVAECTTNIGGLLILLAHFHYRYLAPPASAARAMEPPAPYDGDDEMAPTVRLKHAARLQLLGRILLPSLALYHGCHVLFRNFEREHTSSHTLATYLFDFTLVGSLFAVVGAIVIGLHSRAIALALSVINFLVVCYDHPWCAEIAPRSRAARRSDDEISRGGI